MVKMFLLSSGTIKDPTPATPRLKALVLFMVKSPYTNVRPSYSAPFVIVRFPPTAKLIALSRPIKFPVKVAGLYMLVGGLEENVSLKNTPKQEFVVDGNGKGELVTVKASVFILLQPTPLGVPSHSTSGSTGGVPTCVSAVASGSVKSSGRMILALTVVLVPAAASTFPIIVNVIVASFGKSTVASSTPPVIVCTVTTPPKVEEEVKD